MRPCRILKNINYITPLRYILYITYIYQKAVLSELEGTAVCLDNGTAQEKIYQWQQQHPGGWKVSEIAYMQWRSVSDLAGDLMEQFRAEHVKGR